MISNKLPSILLVFTFICSLSVWAGDKEEADIAFNQGDYSTAIKLYQKAKEVAKKEDPSLSVKLDLAYTYQGMINSAEDYMSKQRYELATRVLQTLYGKHSISANMQRLNKCKEMQEIEKAWDMVTSAYSLKVKAEYCSRYLIDYPETSHTAEAQEIIAQYKAQQEEEYWDNTKHSNTKKAYESYLDEYPGGNHLEDAQNKIQEFNEKDEKTWNTIAFSNNVEEYQGYISSGFTNHLQEAETIFQD